MKQIVCEMCSSNDLVKDGDYFVCQHCGCKYTVEAAKKMMIEGTVKIEGTIKIDETDEIDNLYVLARRAKEALNYEDATRYYNELYQKRPNDWEAALYSAYYTAYTNKSSDISHAAITYNNSMKNIFELILNSQNEDIKKLVDIFVKQSESISSSLAAENMRINFNSENYAHDKMFIDMINEKAADLVATYDKDYALMLYKKQYEYSAGRTSIIDKIKKIDPDFVEAKKKKGCYVATAVYGSYDCPEVWTLRRYRDYDLAKTWYGRLFIKTYYAISPTIVKWFGDTEWFKNMWRGKLDRMVTNLKSRGYEDTPYEDKDWK